MKEELRVESGERRARLTISLVDRLMKWPGILLALALVQHTDDLRHARNHWLSRGEGGALFASGAALLVGTFLWGLLWYAPQTQDRERRSVRNQGLFFLGLLLIGMVGAAVKLHGMSMRIAQALVMFVVFIYGPYSVGRVIGYLRFCRGGSGSREMGR